MAVVSMLKSWPGIFCLCSPHNNGITSLLNMLPLAQPMVQVLSAPLFGDDVIVLVVLLYMLS